MHVVFIPSEIYSCNEGYTSHSEKIVAKIRNRRYRIRTKVPDLTLKMTLIGAYDVRHNATEMYCKLRDNELVCYISLQSDHFKSIRDVFLSSQLSLSVISFHDNYLLLVNDHDPHPYRSRLPLA